MSRVESCWRDYSNGQGRERADQNLSETYCQPHAGEKHTSVGVGENRTDKEKCMPGRTALAERITLDHKLRAYCPFGVLLLYMRANVTRLKVVAIISKVCAVEGTVKG